MTPLQDSTALLAPCSFAREAQARTAAFTVLPLRGDEQRVVDAFARYLSEHGWAVSAEVEFCDLVAEGEGERLFVEAKGRTEAIGTDVDTMYGQILRRMPLAEGPAARFALVVPTRAERAALRVPPRVRALLRVEVFVVAGDGSICGPR